MISGKPGTTNMNAEKVLLDGSGHIPVVVSLPGQSSCSESCDVTPIKSCQFRAGGSSSTGGFTLRPRMPHNDADFTAKPVLV